MFRAHLVIALCTVLEIISVAVAHELLPPTGHLRRCGHEVIFSPEVIGIIGFVDALNIIQKPFEWLSVAVLIKQRRECLVQLMKSLHAGKNVIRPGKASAHRIRHLNHLKGRVES